MRDGIDSARCVAGFATFAGGKSGQSRAEPEPLRNRCRQPRHTPSMRSVTCSLRRHVASVTWCGPRRDLRPVDPCGGDLAAQSQADVSIDGRREPLILWCATIAESGDRKSAVDQIVLEAHRAHERRALEQYRHDERLHAIEVDAHEAAARARRKGKDPAAIEKALVALGPPPEPPLKPLLLVGTPTIEGLHLLYKCGQPSVGLFHDDAGEFVGGHAMDADHRMRSAAGLSAFGIAANSIACARLTAPRSTSVAASRCTS